MGKWKETLVRALRTFAQAVIGYIVANIALIQWDDTGAVKKSVMALITAAVACGLAALMNLPKKGADEDEKGGDEE